MISSSKNISLVSLVISERELQEINIKIENYFNGRRQIAIAFGNKLMFNIEDIINKIKDKPRFSNLLIYLRNL